MRLFQILRQSNLSLSAAMERLQYLRDWQAIWQMFANGELGGYWDPALGLFENSNGTGAAAVNGVVGSIANQISGQPAAIQVTTANKPYLRETPITKCRWLDGNTANANLTATWGSSLGSACTIAAIDPELGVQWSDNQTIATTRNIITPYSYRGPILVINRVLTSAEKSIVARVMMRSMPQLGNELWPQPSFNETSGLVMDASWSISNGLASSNGGIGFIRAANSLPRSTSSYHAKISLISRTAGMLYLPYDGKSANIKTTTATGAHSRVFTPSGVFDGTAYIYGLNLAGSVDDVSIKEIL